MSEPSSNPPPPPADEEMSILLAIYSADRAQAAATVGSIGTVTVAGIGYIAAVTGLVFAGDANLSGLWMLAVPLPAWALFLFQLQLGSMMIARTQSILRLERRFAAFGAYVVLDPKNLGQNAEERLTNMHAQPKSFWPGGVLSYALEPILLAALTGMSVAKADDSKGLGGWVVLGCVVYGVLALSAVVQFIGQARMLKTTTSLLSN